MDGYEVNAIKHDAFDLFEIYSIFFIALIGKRVWLVVSGAIAITTKIPLTALSNEIEVPRALYCMSQDKEIGKHTASRLKWVG